MKKDKKYYDDLELKLRELEKKEIERKAKIKKALADKKRAGCKLGRPVVKHPMFEVVKELYLNKKITQKEAFTQLGVARETFIRWLKDEKSI